MGRVRNAKIGGGGFTGTTFGISGIERDKAGATTHRAVASPRMGRISGGGGGGGSKRRLVASGGTKRANMAHHHSSIY